MTETIQAMKPGRFGIISVWLALGTFSIAMMAAMITVQTSKTPGSLYDVVFPIFAVVFGLLAPMAHVTGFILGVIAIFRRRDSRGAGIVGACLNAIAVGIGVMLIWAALQGLAAFR
jgi:hypothetical protein